MKRINSTRWFRGWAVLFTGALCLGGSLSAARAQVRPVTGISAFYAAVDDTNGNYSVAGGGTGNYPAGTTYRVGFNVGEQNNLVIRAFETGTNVFNYIQLAQQINIVRVDGNVTGQHNIIFFEESSVLGTNVDLKPSLVTTMIDSLRSDLVNRGADNVFANQGDGNGNNNNIERIDYVFNAGFPYYNFTDQRGFLVMDRGGNDRFKIAVILAVDSNGMPTAFSRPVSVSNSDWGSSGITLDTTVMRGYTEGGAPLKPSARTGTQPLSGVFLSWDQFGLTTNDMVYGYSLAGNDVTTNGAYWTQVTNAAYFPRNTTVDSNYGGLDLISGGAMFFDEVLEVGIGDRVWEDYNGDGVQDPNEPGLGNVLVHIYATGDVLAATARTDDTGWYFAQGMGPGSYTVQFFPPDGYSFSPQEGTHDSEMDSDPDSLSGITAPYVLNSGQTNLSVDAGFYLTPGDLGLTKTVFPANVNVGDEIVFTLSVTNAGVPTTALIQVTDALPSAFAFAGYGASTGLFDAITGIWDVGSLSPGAVGVLAITGTVNAGSGGSFVTNQARISQMNRPDTNSADNVASAVFEVQAVDLAVAMDSDKTAMAEEEGILFTIAVTNLGPYAASGIEIVDVLPAGFLFVSATASQGTYAAGTGVWIVGALSSGGGGSLEIAATAATGSGGQYLTNSALVRASSHEDPNFENNQASVVVLIYGADLSIQKSVAPAAAVEGQTVLYTVVVTNPGPSDATGIQVSEPLTNGLSHASHAVSQGSYSALSGIWSVGTLSVGAAATLDIHAIVSEGTMDMAITNRARISAIDQPDPHADNNEDTAVLSVSSLVLSKTSDVDVTVLPGGTITYSIMASNSGSQAHANVTLQDWVPDGTAYVPGSLVVTRTPVGATTMVYASSSVFTAPAGVTSITVEAWGGGAGGGRARGNPSTGGGGAGGAYAKKAVAVTPLQSYTVAVGSGGIGGNGTGTDTQHGRPGNPSWFGATSVVFAEGGARGMSAGNVRNSNGDPGWGSSADSIGDTVYAGGDGSGGDYSYYGYSGAGGGGAGTTGQGGDASDDSGGSGAPLYGGDGADGVGRNSTGADGAGYGGGGSGGKANSSTDRNGGAGADGAVRVSYENSGTVGDPPDLASGWSLAPGQRLEATFTVRVDDPLTLMAITNTATASSDQQAVPVSATVIDPVIHTDLAIAKTASATVLGETESLTYTLTVANQNLQNAATGVAVDDLIPAGFDFTGATPSQGSYHPASGVWAVGTIQAGESATLELHVTAAVGGGGYYWTNTANISAYAHYDPDLSNNADHVVVLIEGADLALSKTVDNPTPNETTQVTYTVIVENQGPSDATGIEVSEPLTNGLSYVSSHASQGIYTSGSGVWSVGSLTNGGVATLTVTAEIDPGIFGSVLTNRSHISASALPDPVSGNNQDEAVVTVSGLRVSKTSDVVGFATPGDIITYTIAVSNLSAVAHSGIQITDLLPAGTLYVADSVWIEGPGTNSAAGHAPPLLAGNRALAAGELLVITLKARVINPGAVTQLVNTVSVACDQQLVPVVARVTDYVRHTDLGLSKSVNDARPDEGEAVVYTLVVTNQGPTPAASIQVVDPLATGVTYVSYSAGQGSYDSLSGVWSVGALAIGTSAQLEITATVDTGTSGTAITNHARISGADMADLAPADNTAFAVVTVVSVDIGIGKSAQPDSPAENSVVAYTLVVTNHGPDAATGVEVTDTLPQGMDYLSHGAGQGTYDSGSGMWSVGSLAPMQVATLGINALVETGTAGTVLTNLAAITAVDQIDSRAENDTAHAVVSPQKSLLGLVKTATPAGPVWAGDIIAYTLAITNRSGTTQTHITLVDPLPAGVAYVADSCRIDVPLTVDATFGDGFSRRVYSNNDGTQLWASDWVEGENNGPTAGSIQIQFDNGVDETYTLRFSGGSQTIGRVADVSSYTSVRLEFDYQRIGLEAGDYVALQISTNGLASPWTELTRFQGAATDADYLHYSADISAYISPTTAIRFISPSGMDSTDILWIDNILITGTRRTHQILPGGPPPALAAGLFLEPDEAMTVQFEVWVENPALYTQIVNQASLSSDQMSEPQVDTAITPVAACFTVAPMGLHADPTNATSFVARWNEVDGCFGYRLDVATDPAFGAADYVPGYSNRFASDTFQHVTNLAPTTLFYFRVRAEWDTVCTSSNSETAVVETLGLPTIGVFPDRLDFGIVDAHASSNLTLTVTNSGTAVLEIDSIEFSGGGSTYFSVLPATVSIPVGGSLDCTVTYAPIAGGVHDLVLILNNNSPDYPDLQVPTRGECYDPAAELPELLAFHVMEATGLTNEVTDRSLGGGMATATFTAYHFTGMTMEGGSFDLIYPDGTVALSQAPFETIEPTTVGGRNAQVLSAAIPRFFPAHLGQYGMRVTVASSNGMWLTGETHFTSVSAGSAIPMSLDNFGRADAVNDIGQDWLSILTGPLAGNVQIRNRVLQLYGPGGTGGTRGRISVVRNLSSRYDPAWTNNAGTMTWAFNFYSGRDIQAGFAPGAYGAAFVLGSDSIDWVTGVGNGYAVRICSNQVALASFVGGLDLDSDWTTIGQPAPLRSATSAVAVLVDLEVETGIWSLYVRESSASGIGAFENPLLDMGSRLISRTRNTVHLHRALPYVGCYWNHGSAPADISTAAFFDDLYAPYVLRSSEPMQFAAIDNDIMLPTALGNVRVNEETVPDEVPGRLDVVWTNAPEFVITFDPLATDQDPGYSIRSIQRDVRGIGEYRVSPDPVNVLSASNRGVRGFPFPVVTTNGALANYGFEMMTDGGDWKMNAQCFYQTRSADAARVYEGSNSLGQTVGGEAYQTFEFRNASGVTPEVAMTGWYRGGPAHVQIAAFATNDLVHPIATVSLTPPAAEDWTSFSLAQQDIGDGRTEFLRVSLAATGGQTYWDKLRFTVDIGTNRSSMRFRAGAENQGLIPQYIYAVDADYNRPGDRLGGLTKFFYIPFDMTPPTPIPMPAGGNGARVETVDDPTSQFDLEWSTTGVGPDNPASPIHPTKNAQDIDLLSQWHSYQIYYGTYDAQVVPLDDDPTSTNSYIYKTYIQNDAFRSWTKIDPGTPIADPTAPGYQPTYHTLTNLETSRLRLYDLDYDQDYVVVVVGVDKAGNVGDADVQSWATNNTIRFALIRGNVIEKSAARAAFPEAQLTNAAAPTAAALHWIASGPTNEQGIYTAVSKDYDLITWDADRFQETTNNQWQLVDTVRSNWFVDDGGQMKARGQLRFYRASYKDRWRTTNVLGKKQRRLASEEVYALHNVILSGGQNFVALHGIPYANTLAGVFGSLEAFPGGDSLLPDSGATLVEFYTSSTNAMTYDQYWLDSDGRWNQAGGGDVTTQPMPPDFFSRGFSITLPDPLPARYVTTNAWSDYTQTNRVPAMIWSPITQVPTNAFRQTIMTGSRVGLQETLVYNVAALRLPVSAHPSQMNLLESGFVNGYRGLSDTIYTINTATKDVRSDSTIYCDADSVWRFAANNTLVPWGFFKPNDVIVIVSRNWVGDGQWDWTYNPRSFYTLPTRWMGD